MVCGIIFDREIFVKDVTGCIKPSSHNDFHVCRTDDGKLIAWEDDYNCECGCWDNYEDDEEVCILYWEVNENFERI